MAPSRAAAHGHRQQEAAVLSANDSSPCAAVERIFNPHRGAALRLRFVGALLCLLLFSAAARRQGLEAVLAEDVHAHGGGGYLAWTEEQVNGCGPVVGYCVRGGQAMWAGGLQHYSACSPCETNYVLSMGSREMCTEHMHAGEPWICVLHVEWKHLVITVQPIKIFFLHK
ncbi:hypothetical protein BS78_07G233400 [Paspalum vaginatum]|nr:hypothetical protein BS78_07G233400 [Paspalum vaginatum]